MSSCNQDNTEIESSQLHLGSFLGLFLLSGIACVIALCIYFTRICRRYRQAARTEAVSELTSSTSNVRRLKTLISLIDERKDPSKKRKNRKEGEEDSPFDDERDEESGRSCKRKESQNWRDGDTDSNQ